MSRQLSKEDILNAEEVYLYCMNTIYVKMKNDDNVYGIPRSGGEWTIKHNFYDYMDSYEIMLNCFMSVTREEVAAMYEDSLRKSEETDTDRINRAILLATERHNNQTRKGTDIPYIMHPMEVMTILSAMNADTDVLIAGMLHDTVEDTDTTIEEIADLFGESVAYLVRGHSEDKSKTWEERKSKDIEDTAAASYRMKQLVLADKLANIRSIYRDYQKIGDNLWKRFNAGVEKQSWYYGKMTDALKELQYYQETRQFYWEMVDLYKEVFVSFRIDRENGVLYQESIDGEAYKFTAGESEWVVCNKTVPEKTINVSRKYAERIEDNWKDDLEEVLARDTLDADYTLYCSTTRALSVYIEHMAETGCLTFKGSDFGKECEIINGKDEYEFEYRLDGEDTYKMFSYLRAKYGINCKTETLLKMEFGYDDGSVRFKKLCYKLGLHPGFSSY